MEPMISVIVPVYNIEEYIGRCIDSIIHQTYNNLEVILVDDGSMDTSGQICDNYAEHDMRIKVIHKENGGLSDARNAAINSAGGEWITFVDGDDFLASSSIESMYRTAEISEAQIVCCLHKFAYEGQKTIFNEDFVESKISIYSQEEALEKMLRKSEFNNSAWAKLYKIELFNEIRYPKGKLFEDIGTTYKLFSAAEKVALVRIEGYGYFIRIGSIQKSKFSPKKMDELFFVKEQKEYIDERFPNLVSATTDRLVSSCFHILFSIIDSNEFETEKKEVEKIIRDNRKKLLFSKDTSKKTRFGCLLSYLGFGFEFRIYSSLGFRDKMMH